MTRTDVGGRGVFKNLHSEIIPSVLMLWMLNWNGQFFLIALLKPVSDKTDKKTIFPFSFCLSGWDLSIH